MSNIMRGWTTYPFATVENHARQVHGSRGNMARAESHEAVVEETDLGEIFADRAGLNLIVIGLRDAAKKVHRVGVAEIVVEGGEDVINPGHVSGPLSERLGRGNADRPEHHVKQGS